VPFLNPGGLTSRVRTPELSSFEELSRRVTILREHADTIGRVEPIDICFSPFAHDAAATVDELSAFEELGVTWAVLHLPRATTRAAWIDAVQRLGDAVIAPYRGPVGRTS
jgi:hypothetical protein